jgi:hypothetical protein
LPSYRLSVTVSACLVGDTGRARRHYQSHAADPRHPGGAVAGAATDLAETTGARLLTELHPFGDDNCSMAATRLSCALAGHLHAAAREFVVAPTRADQEVAL